MSTLVLRVPLEELERACDIVWTHGAYGFEERTLGDGHVELVLARDDALASALGRADPSGRWLLHTEQISTASLEEWRTWIQPIRVDETLVIEPAWTVPAERSADCSDQAALTITIDPEASFGMGDHPTTLLCALDLREILARESRRRPTVLDVGCGSGVLAIIAAVSGSGPVTAIDISASAVDTAHRNAARNGVEITASTTALSQITSVFDIVVGNLLAPIIDELADDLIDAVAPGGTLIVSGLLEEQLPSARRRFTESGELEQIAVSLHSGWGALRLLRPASTRRR